MENIELNKKLSLFFILSIFLSLSVSSESKTTKAKTWFGDPNLQGTWSNQSLTSLERPDEIELSLIHI